MAEALAPNPGNPTPQRSYIDVVDGSIEASSSADRADSASPISPTEEPQPGYSRPHHYILPPIIKGHGHLIQAHRVVPYWVGLILAIGAFAWAVWCALFIYPLLGGHGNDWKVGTGNGTNGRA